MIEKSSRVITRLPYCAEIINFKDKTFPEVDTLMIPMCLKVSTEFLKCRVHEIDKDLCLVWKLQQWKIKNVVASEFTPIVSSFEAFK